MEEVLYFNELYDLYGKLLTEKQQSYFEDYYFNNLSLGEMAENYEVSRNAIFKQVHIVIDKLKEYEEKLQLHRKVKQLRELLGEEPNLNLREKIEQIF